MKNLHVTPKEMPGWVGLWLTLAFVALFVLKVAVSIPVPSYAIFALGILGLIANVWAVARGERSLATLGFGGLVGLFAVIWILAEVLFPH